MVFFIIFMHTKCKLLDYLSTYLLYFLEEEPNLIPPPILGVHKG